MCIVHIYVYRCQHITVKILGCIVVNDKLSVHPSVNLYLLTRLLTDNCCGNIVVIWFITSTGVILGV